MYAQAVLLAHNVYKMKPHLSGLYTFGEHNNGGESVLHNHPPKVSKCVVHGA